MGGTLNFQDYGGTQSMVLTFELFYGGGGGDMTPFEAMHFLIYLNKSSSSPKLQ